MTLADLQRMSASKRELVLPYLQAIAALQLLEAAGAVLIGWEGWLRHPDGRLGHCGIHQGTTDISALSSSEAYQWVKASMCTSQKLHIQQTQSAAAELLFCISVDGLEWTPETPNAERQKGCGT